MADYTFNLLMGGMRFGKAVHASGASVRPGLLVAEDSSGSNTSGGGGTYDSGLSPYGYGNNPYVDPNQNV